MPGVVNLVRELRGLADTGRVPAPAVPAVGVLTATTARIVDRLDVLGPAAGHAAAVVADIVQAAHTVVARYLRLPAEFACHRVIGDAVTAQIVLVQQLDLLADHLATVAEAVDRAEAAALIAHGADLAARYATGYEPTPTEPIAGPVTVTRERVGAVTVTVTVFTVLAAVLGATSGCDHPPHHTTALPRVHTAETVVSGGSR